MMTTMSGSSHVRVTLALAVLAAARPATAAPEDSGSLPVVATSVQAPVDGATLATDLYTPQSGGPYPTIVLRHGFLRGKQNFVAWGKHLASRGFVAIIPTSRAPAAPNPAVDSDDMLALLDWAKAQSGQTGSPLQSKVDEQRLAVIGHSAGGLAAALAAAKRPTLRAAVLFDPVDVGPGAAAAPTTKMPVAVLFAEPGACNLQGNYVPIYQTFGGPRFGLKVIGAQHCAPEDPSDAVCELACGGAATTEQHTAFRRYATAFLEVYLRCDPSSQTYLDGAAAKVDKAIALLPSQGLSLPPAGCPAVADGSRPKDAAGPRDAVADRGPRDAVADRGPGGEPHPGSDVSSAPADTGCGCGTIDGKKALTPLLLLGLAVLLSVRARSRR
jgi:pimeloyl-ACP methyl ester carboxylesterase